MSADSDAGENGNALPHENTGPKLVACLWALTGTATVLLSLRIYCRLLKGQRLWWDDAVLIASWVCVLVDAGLMTYNAHMGYGLHTWDFDSRNLQALVLSLDVSGTFSITAAVWSKTSFGITLLRIMDGWAKKFTWFCLISMNIAMGLTALFTWVNCTPVRKTWDLSVQDGSCWPGEVLLHYNMFSAAYSAFLDIVFAGLPWKFLWGLQMRRGEKLGVGLAMSLGVFAGIAGFVKAALLPRMLSTDFADGVDLVIWGNAESCLSIVAASIPMLRVFVRDVKSSRQYRSGYAEQTGTAGNYSRFVTITSQAGPPASDVELDKMGDEGSDRSILGTNADPGRAKNGIVQVTDITVKYDDNRPGRSG
ncbi:5889bcb4-e80d-4a4a-a150-786807b6c81e [Thermothielavioides terrestris]|uniref:Rhodopsin domain-containing protein n=2 Tax=Thermothielavioides terrestris TaxID=2587410 RepID=G2RDW6_THETT|nr:uncharacterized protein THITE_2092354 [Thermothielavioides terrestris NRRL 8126]AEO70849.1 hypothetical protein THITE_2092354 [Thermothielavioides terrestris NRRL 8126]SPQ25168.1 5889bcb4-e80d-4a4a-a150-786807b6c81e [Thermothielavioides terrestris]